MKQQSSSIGHLWVFDMYTTKLINRSFDHLLLNFFLQRFFFNLMTYFVYYLHLTSCFISLYAQCCTPFFSPSTDITALSFLGAFSSQGWCKGCLLTKEVWLYSQLLSDYLWPPALTTMTLCLYIQNITTHNATSYSLLSLLIFCSTPVILKVWAPWWAAKVLQVGSSNNILKLPSNMYCYILIYIYLSR